MCVQPAPRSSHPRACTPQGDTGAPIPFLHTAASSSSSSCTQRVLLARACGSHAPALGSGWEDRSQEASLNKASGDSQAAPYQALSRRQHGLSTWRG